MICFIIPKTTYTIIITSYSEVCALYFPSTDFPKNYYYIKDI